jgi:signal transduction histidine kinase
VKAVLGQAGSVEGIDYRGVPVIGNVRAIPNSPWFMVARIDAAEAYAPLRRRLWEIVAFIVSLVLVAGAGVGLVWRQQRTSFYRERYHAAAALQESEQKFRALFESMTEGVALHELLYDVNGKAMDYRILAVNPAFEVHTGIARETIVGALASQAYGAGSPPYLETYAGVAESGTPAVFETYFPPLEKHFQISAISPKRGQFATVFEDITGRKQKEELLRQQNEDITRFAYTVSHDLKSPLVTILAFLGFLEEDLQKTDASRIAKDIAYIRSAAEKMSRLLDELLEYSRIGRKANSPEAAPLQAVVQEAVDLVAGRIAACGAHIQVTPEPILLYGDRPRLVEIFQNLVDNAVKFMGDQPDPTVEIGVELEEGELVIFVRDNGIGIDPRFHKKLFNLFEKLDAASEGTGIGLAMVKRIVEVHGGTIWVESRGQGHGTTFYFTLANMVRAQPKEAAG